MRSTATIDRLEGRTLLSDSAVVNGKAYQIGELGAAGIGTEILVNDGSVSWATAVVGDKTGRRIGTFALPTIAADGSATIKGSAGDDVITAERTTGVHEQPRVANNDADLEIDFINLIGSDGKRVMSSLLTNSMQKPEDYVRNIERAKAELQAAIDDHTMSDAEREETLKEDQKQVDSYEAAYETYKLIQSKIESGDFIHYTLDRVYDYYVEVSPDATSSARISVDSGAGNDNVSISQNVPMKTVINGGSGADKLTSGKRTTSLSGGGGNDILISRSVKGGTLNGGKGSDRYLNRAVASGDAGEVHVLARNDGDRVIVASGAVPVIRAGTFGTSEIDKHSYYLMDTSSGQIDLLA